MRDTIPGSGQRSDSMVRFAFLFMASAALVAFSASDVAAQCYGGHGGYRGGFAYYGSPGVSVSYGGGHYGGHYGHVYSAPIVHYGGGYGYHHYPVYRSNYYPARGYRPYYGGYGYGHGHGHRGSGWSFGIRF